MEWGNPWAFVGLLALPLLWYWGRGRLRESRRWMAALALGLRTGFLLLMLAALAAPTLLLPERQTDWLFLIDHSHSVPPAVLDWARQLVEDTESGRAARDRVAVMSFGADSALDLPFGETLERQPIGGRIDPTGTDLESALQSALAELPDAHRQRIVLVTDGNETVGRALDAALPLRSRGVRVHAVAPPADPAAQEVVVENLVLPNLVQTGDSFTVEVVVHAARAAQGVLQLFRDGEVAGQYRVNLEAGRNVFPIALTAQREGQRLIRATIDSEGDRRPENNRFQRYLTVEGGSRVLLVGGDEAETAPLVQALGVQGLEVTEATLATLPTTAQALQQYDVVIFANAPGLTLSRGQMELLEAYVRDHGGGFVMTGGEYSFGGGGYHETPLEAMLPVDMTVEDQVRLPTVALVLVIDRSDSMGSEIGGTGVGGSKLEVAKLASLAAMELLNPRDRVALVAFDTRAEWIVPLTEAGRRDEITAQLARLKVGGGTDLYVGLNLAVDGLGDVRAHKKHIIALSDGLTPIRRYEELVKGAAGSRITISTVALGDTADQLLLRNVANWGKGRFYFTDDPLRIPRIFTTETMMATQGLIEERNFTPHLQAAHEILQGIDAGALPPLHGYVVTSAKPSAQVVLSGPDDDPLLAVRQYGLGRSVAFTSDLSTGWGREWVNWSAYPRLVTQLVRWAERRSGEGNIELDVRTADSEAEVVADLYDDAGRFLNRFDVQARVTDPDDRVREVTLRQEAPGRYRGAFDLERSGDYLLTVSAARDGVRVGPETLGLTVPYGAEYRAKPTDRALLAALAAQTGGRFFDGAPREAVVDAILSEEAGDPVRKPIWPWLLVAGLLLFIADIALRQIGWLPQQQEHEMAESTRTGPPRRGGEVDLDAAVAERAAEARRRERAG